MRHEVGQFTYDTETGTLTGPAEYMQEKGNAKLEDILAGRDVVANFGMLKSPNAHTAVLVALQTDYAGWHGMQLFNRQFRRG